MVQHRADASANRTVARAMAILELVARERDGMSLSRLATELEAPRSSVHYIVRELVAGGYLVDTGSYGLGPAIGTLLASRGPAIDRLAQQSIRALHERFDETIVLSVRVGDWAVNLDILESTRPIRFSAPTNVRLPLHTSAVGRCLLAFSADSARERYVAACAIDDQDRRRLRADLTRIVRTGFAVAKRDATPELGGVAAPILHDDKLLGVLAVAGPTSRIGPHIATIAHAVVEEATRTSARFSPTLAHQD